MLGSRPCAPENASREVLMPRIHRFSHGESVVLRPPASLLRCITMAKLSRDMPRGISHDAMAMRHRLPRLVRPLLVLLALCSLTSAEDKPASSAPVFQMRLVAEDASPDTEAMVHPTKSDNPGDWPTLHVEKKVLLDDACLKKAFVVREGDGSPSIDLEFTGEGAERFAEVTRQAVGQRLAIVIDGTLWSAPNIREPITGGHARVSGNFTAEEAAQLAAKIEAAVAKQSR